MKGKRKWRREREKRRNVENIIDKESEEEKDKVKKKSGGDKLKMRRGWVL